MHEPGHTRMGKFVMINLMIMPILHVYWQQYNSYTLGKKPNCEWINWIAIVFLGHVCMTCTVHIVDYIDTFVNIYYQNKWTCVTLLKLVFFKIVIQYSSIQISLSVSKSFILFKRYSKTHYKCCVFQQRELIFTVFSTMSNFPDSCRILIMIQLIAMCWPHFQAISFSSLQSLHVQFIIVTICRFASSLTWCQ